jgi:2-(1,2-epoxy-1,2-dihydrophenyl)acetyl-CoA isomerase
MAAESVGYRVDRGVAMVTLNRPTTLNSFTRTMHGELRIALESARTDDAVRAVLITGAGRAFCAGQDLAEIAADPDADLGIAVEQHWNPLIRALTGMPKPVVCAVNGVAAGAGASIALACDLVLAGKSASFIQSFAKLGLIPDSGGTWHLPRAVGMARAKGLAMLGEKLSASDAAQWGLIWRCVEDDVLMAEATALATQLATQPTAAFANIKRLMHESGSHSLHEQLELEQAAMRALGRSHDYREGVAAFLAKRPAQFKGN